MVQSSFLEQERGDRIVNVASVPQRSPFRYPGGKTWLVPQIRQWLASLPAKPPEFIEPFAGGAIVGLTVAFENWADTVTLVELDDQVAAVWRTILSDDAKWLADRVLSFTVTKESVESELAKLATDVREKAFQTLLKNRVYHGGILAPGSSLIKYGENGKGLTSRWYPQTLARRILNIALIRNRIRFIEGDGLKILRETAHRPDVVYFLDPPYTVAGKKAGTRLYTYNELDHEALFGIAETLTGDFLMTYDNAIGVLALAQRHGFDTHTIPMQNTHHAEMTELLIGRSLEWARGFIHTHSGIKASVKG